MSLDEHRLFPVLIPCSATLDTSDYLLFSKLVSQSCIGLCDSEFIHLSRYSSDHPFALACCHSLKLSLFLLIPFCNRCLWSFVCNLVFSLSSLWSMHVCIWPWALRPCFFNLIHFQFLKTLFCLFFWSTPPPPALVPWTTCVFCPLQFLLDPASSSSCRLIVPIPFTIKLFETV